MGGNLHPEPGWNPYRWVAVSGDPIRYKVPSYHHCFQGLSGRLECTLEALTPLFVGDSRGRFVGLSGGRKEPIIPATSLKGAIRALAELIGNAAVPFPKSDVDPAHRVDRCSSGTGTSFQLDIAARVFGHLAHNRNESNFRGLVRFSDAALVSSPVDPTRWPIVSVVAGSPKRTHWPFYPTEAARKLYHHKTEATELTRPQANIRQLRQVNPAPPATVFRFLVDFENLRAEELSLLCYCLVLEDDVTVTLSAAALGADFHGPISLRGPLRHKVGGCKPQGAGSVCVRVSRLTLREDPVARYRAGSNVASVFEGPPLSERLGALTGPIAGRRDPTMEQLRAMMIYAPDDPRPLALDYPSYAWFEEDRARPAADKGRIKPTL